MRLDVLLVDAVVLVAMGTDVVLLVVVLGILGPLVFLRGRTVVVVVVRVYLKMFSVDAAAVLVTMGTLVVSYVYLKMCFVVSIGAVFVVVCMYSGMCPVDAGFLVVIGMLVVLCGYLEMCVVAAVNE